MTAGAAGGQDRITLRTDLTFYGDNTEFFNGFREGETLLGTTGQLAVDIQLSDRVSVRAGVFGNHRNGSQELFEEWRPVLGLVLHTARSEFLFGTIDSPRHNGPGPDRAGPHDLVPPLQRETLAFTRPYEAGLQWKLHGPQLEQDAWLNWQRLNTSEQRERFDVGFSGRLPIELPVPVPLAAWLAYQFHIVHEGGQLFDAGPVGESLAGGPGLVVERPIWRLDRAAAELFTLWSRHVPDRTRADARTSGFGALLRLSGEKNGWRAHLIAWRAANFIKEEGDENYLSRQQDGSMFEGARSYGELGLTRVVRLKEGLDAEGSVRLHRIENRTDYSYRVLARVRFDLPLRTQ